MSYIYSTSRTKRYLQRLLELGNTGSAFDYYVDVYIRNSFDGRPTFYIDVLSQDGVDAAEAALAKWESQGRVCDLSFAVEPAVRGLLAVSSVEAALRPEAQWVRMTDIDSMAVFPGHYLLPAGGKSVSLFNDLMPEHGQPQPRHADNFGPDGHLGLRAITFTYGNGTGSAELGLVLPVRITEPGISQQRLDSGFTIVQISRYGQSDAVSVIPDQPDPQLLPKMLGLAGGVHPTFFEIQRDSIEETTGLPDIVDFLADNLPQLQDYLTDLAAQATQATAGGR